MKTFLNECYISDFLGYGHIVPATPVGKLATIFYAIFGIPLFLLYLSNIGDIMAKSFKFIYSRICKCQRDHKPPEQIPSGILKKPDSYRVQMLPQHVHGLSQTGIAGGPEESTSSMASGMIGKKDSKLCYLHFHKEMVKYCIVLLSRRIT